eukprot:2091323-Rhodomonas_salina.1
MQAYAAATELRMRERAARGAARAGLDAEAAREDGGECGMRDKVSETGGTWSWREHEVRSREVLKAQQNHLEAAIQDKLQLQQRFRCARCVVRFLGFRCFSSCACALFPAQSHSRTPSSRRRPRACAGKTPHSSRACEEQRRWRQRQKRTSGGRSRREARLKLLSTAPPPASRLSKPRSTS